jgi:hypothetical protein
MLIDQRGLSRTFGVLLAVVFVVVLCLILVGSRVESLPLTLAVLAFVVVVIGGCSLLRTSLRLEQDALVLRIFPLLSHRIPLSELESAEVGPVTGIKEGAGYRLLPQGRTGYLVGGPSVEITAQGHTWVVSVSDPERVVRAVTEAARERKSSRP